MTSKEENSLMLDTFYERFPDIALVLSLAPKIATQRLYRQEDLYSEDLSAELTQWSAHLELEEKEIVYIYGLGFGYYLEPLREWLAADKRRKVLFIEDDLTVIESCLEAQSFSFCEEPQVYLRYLPNKREWPAFLEQLVYQFPTDRILFTALKSYEKRFPTKCKKMRLLLQRKSAFIDALFTDVLHSDHLFKNLYPNFRRIPESFFANKLRGRFVKIPAIICGAGPSLTREYEALKALENRALIFAGGSAITALSKAGVSAHMHIALDPNLLEYKRLKAAEGFAVPFLFAPRLFPDVFSLSNGPFGYLRSDTGGAAENGLEEHLGLKEEAIGPDLDQEALSVTTLALSTAYAFGCDPIILVGVDLAYTDKQLYADGVVEQPKAHFAHLQKEAKAIDQLVRRKDRLGKPVYTLVKWVMESAVISSYAHKHPERLFINSTEGGLGFAGLTYHPLKEVANTHCLHTYDLEALLHAEIEGAHFPLNYAAQIDSWLEELGKSLERMRSLVRERIATQSLGKQALLESDLEEELAFKTLFVAITPALERWLEGENAPEEKWIHYQNMIAGYLSAFKL